MIDSGNIQTQSVTWHCQVLVPSCAMLPMSSGVALWGLRVDAASIMPYKVAGCGCCLATGQVAGMLGRRGIGLLFHVEHIPLLHKPFSVNVRI